jgi:hypothetical protein
MSKVAISTVLCIASVTAFLSLLSVEAVSEATTNNVTFIGTVSCSRCQGYPPVHKGYTRWTWAVHSVIGEGDEIVLVVGNNLYKLQGDKDQLLKYMEDKVEVTGNLEGRTLVVQTIARPDKKR